MTNYVVGKRVKHYQVYIMKVGDNVVYIYYETFTIQTTSLVQRQ